MLTLALCGLSRLCPTCLLMLLVFLVSMDWSMGKLSSSLAILSLERLSCGRRAGLLKILPSNPLCFTFLFMGWETDPHPRQFKGTIFYVPIDSLSSLFTADWLSNTVNLITLTFLTYFVKLRYVL
jgi:hypothetical protein